MSDLKTSTPPLPNYVTFMNTVTHSIRFFYTHGLITEKEREKIWKRADRDYWKKVQEGSND